MTANLSAPQALALIEHCPSPMLFTDAHDRITGCNRAFRELVGISAEQLSGRQVADLVDHPAGGLLDREEVVCWNDGKGEARRFRVSRIRIEEGGTLEARLYTDIGREAELEQTCHALNQELDRSILTDRFTGLLNQRGVMLALEPQVARSRRYNSPMAVIMMELTGGTDDERVRLHTARLLKDQLRWADLVGLSEQREFMLVLPETTREAALQLAEKLMPRIQDMAAHELDGAAVNACYGVTGWRRSDSADSLLNRAAQALSQARAAPDPQPVAL